RPSASGAEASDSSTRRVLERRSGAHHFSSAYDPGLLVMSSPPNAREVRPGGSADRARDRRDHTGHRPAQPCGSKTHHHDVADPDSHRANLLAPVRSNTMLCTLPVSEGIATSSA